MNKKPMFLLLGLPFVLFSANAAELAPNRPELSLPLLDKKMVVAHFMTGLVDNSNGAKNPQFYSNSPIFHPTGDPEAIAQSKSIGPMYLFLYRRGERSGEEVARSEIVAARALGVDGFQFFYPCSGDALMASYNKTIVSFFRVAEQEFPDFKLTLCLCNPQVGTEAEKIARWAKHINALLAETRESPAWLKSPDGRTVMYQWVGDPLADAVGKNLGKVLSGADAIRAIATAYEKLAQAVELPIAYVYHLRYPENEQHVNQVFDYFPAVWTWTDGDRMASFRRIDEIAKSRERTYSVTIYPEFYGHDYIKGMPKGKAGLPIRGAHTPVAQLHRSYQPCRLTYIYRSLLELAVETDTPLISVATWNDYGEATHLAPEINHNFVPGILLNYYKRLWQKHPNPIETETAMAIFKKYPSTSQPTYAIDLLTDRGLKDPAEDDHIEVVTLLKEEADLYVNGTMRRKMGAGLDSYLAPLETGPVRVQIKRNGQNAISLESPEWITDRPYRTDRVSYMISSDFEAYFRRIFGSQVSPVFLREYAQDGDGVPNWEKGYQVK